MEYKGKLLVFVDFTCKATQSQDDALQTHVYMSDRNKKSILILEITKEKRGNTNPIPVDKGNCSKAEALVGFLEDDLIPCWRCQTAGGVELELDYIACRSATQCNSMHSNQNKGRQCLTEDVKKPEQCKIFSTVDFNPKGVVCKNFGPALAQFYFFGVYRGKDYRDENETAVHPPICEEITITCEYSKYYFALGSWFGVMNGSGTTYIKGQDIKPCDTGVECFEAEVQHLASDTKEGWRGTYSASLSRKFEEIGKHMVFCNGPVWNTTEWVNASLSFDVKEGEHPEVISVEPDSLGEFIVGQLKRQITCSFKGRPKPTVEWTGPKEAHYTTFDGGNFSQITFSEIGYQTSGTYTCKVSSFLGNHSDYFTFKTSDQTRGFPTFGIIAIVISGLLIVLVAIVVIVRMRSIIQTQREALRILTEAEIEEFVQGNPELIEKARVANEYFNNAPVIDALPYDQKYEIHPDNLTVDYSCVLGTGEYGVVLKGKVYAKNAKQYVTVANLHVTMDASSANSQVISTPANGEEEIQVAVKTCKKDVDVTNFKALLSEIKVMAYLGHHKCLVSLIGASTSNIKNRELLIIVEFCQNGDLESYLHINKQKFLNKVKYGIYSDGNEANASQGDRTYLNLIEGAGDPTSLETCIFSSDELFKWTYEIAEAIEYMHSKKVIHADLAVRNVLLTHDLRAKVSDFGLSRQLIETSSYTKKTQCALPWRHLAIESLRNLEFSVKSDVWAFGVTLWELYTLGDKPYPGLSYTLDFMKYLETGALRLSKPDYATNEIYEFMLMCWRKVPEDRPNASEVQIICDKLLRRARH
ncbi:unnamed protein product [Orchesella dallaii]|uniref:receptor protein-tyrosine kinase n=1 Tax=Orchesella dallaii TaxID=48710 RepID=A0ABP1Q876_9HEXA